MMSIEDYEKQIEELLSFIQKRRESLEKLRYRMEAAKETSKNPTMKNVAHLWEFVSAMYAESYVWHEMYIDAFEKSRKYLEELRIWIVYFKKVIPSLESKMDDKEKMEFKKLEARLREIEEYKPFLEHMTKRIREILEREKRRQKDIGRIIS